MITMICDLPPTATDDQIWWAPGLQAHLFFEVLFAFEQPIEDSLVAELLFSNGLDDGDDVEWLMISFFHDVLWSVVTDWLVFVFIALCMLLCFRIGGCQREFSEGSSTDWPVFDLQLCTLLRFRRGSYHRKVSLGSSKVWWLECLDLVMQPQFFPIPCTTNLNFIYAWVYILLKIGT
jgi:hypothetical protein